MKRYKIWMQQSSDLSRQRADYIDVLYRKFSELAGVTYINSSIEAGHRIYEGRTLFRRLPVERKESNVVYYAIVETDDYEKVKMLKKFSICSSMRQWTIEDLIEFEPRDWEKQYDRFIKEVDNE